MSNTPSKAEIEALVKRHGATSYRNRADTQHPAYGFTEDGLNGLIDEVLAKWGTPQPENLGFTIENRAGADVVVWKEGGCRPATSAEIAMWKALSAVQQPVVREPLTCEWTHNDDDGYWDTSCGKAWRFDDGGPKENNMNFCHCCGKTLRIKGGQHGTE